MPFVIKLATKKGEGGLIAAAITEVKNRPAEAGRYPRAKRAEYAALPNKS